jgi:hypothetical protein
MGGGDAAAVAVGASSMSDAAAASSSDSQGEAVRGPGSSQHERPHLGVPACSTQQVPRRRPCKAADRVHRLPGRVYLDANVSRRAAGTLLYHGCRRWTPKGRGRANSGGTVPHSSRWSAKSARSCRCTKAAGSDGGAESARSCRCTKAARSSRHAKAASGCWGAETCNGWSAETCGRCRHPEWRCCNRSSKSSCCDGRDPELQEQTTRLDQARDCRRTGSDAGSNEEPLSSFSLT